MGQITFRLSDDELDFLRWYADKESTSMSTLYRDVTLDSYRTWRLNILSGMYSNGEIGFKELCKRANLSFSEGLNFLEENSLEPPITETMDKYTSSVRNMIIESLLEKK